MGRFHCILDSCAEVWYKEYLEGYLSYQYPNEPAQRIYGGNLTYKTEPVKGSCPSRYEILFEWDSNINDSNPPQRAWHLMHYSLRGAVNITGIYYTSGQTGFPSVEGVARGGRWYYLGTAHDQLGNEVILTPASIVNQLPGQGGIYTVARGKFLDIRPYQNQADGCLCSFEIYRDGETIFSRTDEACPVVNVVPCHLSDEWKKVNIDKEPYWQKIQVVDNNSWSEIISELKEFINGEIPPECIEVWKTPVLDLDVLPGNTRAEKYTFIGQYCSATGCPPPEYKVICHEDCKGCPEGTCEVDCGDHLCCYDEQGIAVESIPK